MRELIENVRKRQTRVGTRKIYCHIAQELKRHGIKMGRDALFDFMRENRMLVRKTKRHHITTDSKHRFRKSPNRLKDLTLSHAEQALVADITYVRIENDHAYLALVTDAYSKKIMGYRIDTNMRAQLVVDALKMALENRIHKHREIIHHSDRGIQYCCPQFEEFANKNNVLLSTTQQYDPYENAVAERVNGILKYEFGLIKTLPTLAVAQKMVKQAVEIYNAERLHYSLEMKTPNWAHVNQAHVYKKYSLN